jgi:small conductance mechanosensitive channel
LLLKNYLGAEVFLPNRTITNVINYPRRYVRCLVDVTLSRKPKIADQMEALVQSIVADAVEQFSGLFITEPSSEGRIKTRSGKEFLRIKFRIWPGRGTALETTLKQEIVQSLKELDSAYADWMVTVNYEVEKNHLRSGESDPFMTNILTHSDFVIVILL